MSTNITSKFQDWQTYRSDLRFFPRTAKINLDEIRDKLRNYRVVMAGLEHKPDELDNNIYSSYLNIDGEIVILSQDTNRRPLIINSRKRLEYLWLSWKKIIEEQNNLLSTLDNAARELKQFNHKQIQSKNDQIENRKRDEKIEELESVRISLETAINDLENQDLWGNNGKCGSEAHVFGDEQPQWIEQFNISLNPASLNLQGTEQVLNEYYKLGEIVREAPAMATAIQSLEERYCQLRETHESLSSMGHTLVQEEEFARIAVMIYEKIPNLWVAGDFNELDGLLDRIDKSINYYQAEFDGILSIERDRRPGLTNVLALNHGNHSSGYEDLIVFARTLVSAVDARDRFMQGHSKLVTQYALQIGRNLNWSQTELEQLELAGLLHDVGKLNVPEGILTKTSPLTSKEWSIIQIHPLHSAKIIKPVKRLKKIVPWVLYHQERWDGKGYPDRLKKKDIPTGSSIISLAEAYSAMTTSMPHRNALSKEEAIENIKRESGKQFNPEVTEAFLDTLEKMI